MMKRLIAVLAATVCGVAMADAPVPTVTLTADESSIACGSTGASVTFNFGAQSNAASPATTWYTLDSGTQVALTPINEGGTPGGWTVSGPLKSFSGSFTVSGLSNGLHTVQFCADQSGIGIAGCAQDTVDIECGAATNECKNKRVFGEVVGNKNLCAANGSIEFQFQGDFGDPATLTAIAGSGQVFEVSLSPNGACIYHYNWQNAATTNPPAGAYNFFVNGGGATGLEFSAVLSCNKPKR